MQSGRSVSSWTMRTALASSSGSSVSGTPMLTSSTSAPPATCALHVALDRRRSPARSCSWKILRPVGLIRSPMRQNGWSWPIVMDDVAELSTVCMLLLETRADG